MEVLTPEDTERDEAHWPPEGVFMPPKILENEVIYVLIFGDFWSS